MFSRIAIVNRGEAAMRVIHAVRELNAQGGHQIETDIVKALGDGTLGAASLDVFQSEPLSSDSPLWTLDNAYLTPHIAAISNIDAGVRYFSRIILDHGAGKSLPNVVDRTRGY